MLAGIEAEINGRPVERLSANVVVPELGSAWIELDLETQRATVVSGRILVDGKPPGPWSIGLLGPPSSARHGQPPSQITLQPSGEFELEAPEAGTWQLVLSSPAPHSLRFVQTVELDAAGLEWNLNLSTGSLQIENVTPSLLQRTQDSPTPKEVELLFWPQGELSAICLLGGDAEGRCLLPQVPSGKVQILRIPLSQEIMDVAGLQAQEPIAEARVQAASLNKLHLP